jgi:3-deoxy-D-manno-octulosonic-acid transferase
MWTKIWFAFYTLGIHLGNFYIFLGSFFSQKLNLLYTGRKRTLISMTKVSSLQHPIWIHCASLGEFEQGRPLIEYYKSKYPDQAILLSFFSPSGYEIRKNYPMADEIIYLPSDLSTNAASLIKHFRPSMLILVKYEFWWNTIKSAQENKIPIYLISGIFRENDYFFKPLFKPFKELLNRFDFIFTQDKTSSEILTNHNIVNHFCVGDTRIDRVIDNTKNIALPEKISSFTKDKITIIYGSAWMSDIEVVKNCIAAFPNFNHVIAPHDINPKNIKAIRNSLGQPSLLYSEMYTDAKVLIIDNIGMLSTLYSIADYVYIGGGFQKGIHNILEPAVFYLPVFFGPNHQKFNEAVRLTRESAAFNIDNANQMIQHILEFEKSSLLKDKVRNSLIQYFDENRGATEKIVRHLHHQSI